MESQLVGCSETGKGGKESGVEMLNLKGSSPRSIACSEIGEG